MSHFSQLRPAAVALILVVTAAATIATSPAPTLTAESGRVDVTLSPDEPTVGRRIRVHMKTRDERTSERAGAMLSVHLFQPVPAVGPDAGAPDVGAGGEDAGTMDAGTPAGGPQLLAVLRGQDGQAMDSEVVLLQPGAGHSLMVPALEGCTARECESSFTVELSLSAEPPSSPVSLTLTASVSTELDPGDGELTVELLE